MQKTSLYLIVIGLVCTDFAIAAPSVKKLGIDVARIGTNTTVVHADKTNASTVPQQRLSTVKTTKTQPGTTVSLNTVGKTSTVAKAPDESRLSLGKYIHATGTANGTIVSGTTAPISSSSDFVNLVDRVSNLENDVESKQAALSAGAGLSLDNNTIALNEDIATLPGQVDELQDAVDAKISKSEVETNYYNKDAVDAIIQAIQSGMTHKYNATVPVGSAESEELADVWLQ